MSTFAKATQYPVRWWGYPLHGPRRIKPSVLLVVHITGNSKLPNALAEATYSNRDGSGASFTFVTNRDGSIVQCLQPETQTPWTNGDINQPNTAIPTVKAMVGSPYNPNEFCFMTCENVGYEPGNPITTAQRQTLGELLAWGSKLSGLPINRSTVLGHRDINNVTRHNCPTSGNLEALLGDVIARGLAVLESQQPSNTIEELPVWTTEVTPADELVTIPANTQTYTDTTGTKGPLRGPAEIHAVVQTATHWAYPVNTGGLLFIPKGTLKHRGYRAAIRAEALKEAATAVNAVKP